MQGRRERAANRSDGVRVYTGVRRIQCPYREGHTNVRNRAYRLLPLGKKLRQVRT